MQEGLFWRPPQKKTIDGNEGAERHQRRTTKRTLKRVIWAGRKAISRTRLCNHYFIKFSFVFELFLYVRSDIEMEFIEDYWLEFWFSFKGYRGGWCEVIHLWEMCNW